MDSTEDDVGAFARVFLAALISWNGAEFSAKLILSHLLGETKVSLAVVADMGNRAILDGLTATSYEVDEPAVRDHLTHFCKGFRIILGYRNLYVHNLRLIKAGTGKPPVGKIYQMKGTGRLRVNNQTLSLADVREFCEWTSALGAYAIAVRALIAPKQPSSPDKPASDASSLQKPQWPASPQTTLDFLQ